MEKLHGLTQIYTGNGKGKSTAAFGLAVRASGCGMKVVIVQFMKKGEWYGEIEGFRHLPNVDIFSYGGGKFLKKGVAPDEENLADRKSTRLNSSHPTTSRMPSSA